MGLIDAYLNWCDRNMPGYSRPDPAEKQGDGPCARCEETIDRSVLACPACGNSPFKDAKWNGVKMMIAGAIASITVIGAVIGIPLFILGALSRLNASNMSPVDHDTGGTV